MLHHYETERGLRKAVEKRYGQVLEDKTWQMVKPDYVGPYDEPDVTDILRMIPGHKPEERKRKRGWRTLWVAWAMGSAPNPTAERLRPRVRDFRITELELSEPIPFEKLKETLIELGATTERLAGIPLSYPFGIAPERADEKYGRVFVPGFWEIDYLFTPLDSTHRLSHLHRFILFLSFVLKCHAAIALTFVMCDFIPQVHLGPVVIKDGQEINIQVSKPDVSPEKVSHAYSETRRIILLKNRRMRGKWPRPRGLTKRVLELLIFVMDETPSVSWKEHFNHWNTKYPEWAYDSVHSMQVVYYRTSRWLGRRR